MSFNYNKGYPDVPQSITNPNVVYETALDKHNPFSFVDFLNCIKLTYEPEACVQYYNHYLILWGQRQNQTESENAIAIQTRYVDFLKDISLNYTTVAERKFLTQIDFSDPYDLEVAISFYSKKIKEIVLYYQGLREDAKYELTRKKLKGSNFGAAKKIYEIILTYLETHEEKTISFDYNQLKQNLAVEIEELYDNRDNYFNLPPDEKDFNRKSLDYGENIFLRTDEDLINSIFAGVSSTIRDLKEADLLFDNKRSLTTKHIGTDFYYLSTNAQNQYITGQLFKADAPVLNLLNRNWPTNAAVFSNQIKTIYEIGHFKPTNTSILIIDAKDYSVNVNSPQLVANSLYVFPDPALYGNDIPVFEFVINESLFKRGWSTGKAQNQPNTKPTETSLYGYASKINPDISLNQDLNNIFNQGYIHNQEKDLHGNIFALIKNNGNFQQERRANVPNVTYIKSLLLDGHTFYDDLYGEGYEFDYSIFDNTTYNDTIRSGLTSYTNSFELLSEPYYLFLRYFYPYEELLNFDSQTTVLLKDGAFFQVENFPLLDPVSSDLSAFDASIASFYFTELYEGGLFKLNPATLAFLDPLSAANFLLNPRGPDIVDANCGKFTDNVEFKLEL
jgi:hypothetical protein